MNYLSHTISKPFTGVKGYLLPQTLSLETNLVIFQPNMKEDYKSASRIDVIESIVSKELTQIQSNVGFWGMKLPVNCGVDYEQPHSNPLERDVVKLETLLRGVDFESLDQEEKLLVAIGWQFIWGSPIPKNVSDFTDQTLMQGRNRDLSPLEETLAIVYIGAEYI